MEDEHCFTLACGLVAHNCPFCLDMNGTIVELDDTFLDEGDTQDVEWQGKDISMSQDYSDVAGPPLHPNCRCAIVGQLDEDAEKAFNKDLSQKGATDDADGIWRTVHGTPVFIREGQSINDAIKERFGKKDSETHESSLSVIAVHGKNGWKTSDGKNLPPHVAKLILPPAWTNVKYDPNPKADLVASGKDSKGREQRVYSEAHWTKAAATKFARTKELLSKREEILKENDSNLKDPSTKENAACMRLIMSTGIRPGSDADTGAEKKAFGATTLQGRHVIEDKDGVRLKFIGKKGVALDIAIENKEVAKDLISRSSSAGKHGGLFDTDNSNLLKYAHSLDGGKFKTKDMRTMVGTKTALDAVKAMSTPKTFNEYKSSVRAVAKEVSLRLGNTPIIALQSYIDPAVFSGWQKPGWKEEK